MMRLAVLPEPGRFEIVEEPIPAIAEDEVLVRVAACGVCASELDIFSGKQSHAKVPWYPGHEVSGVVERKGRRARKFRRGDPVAVWVTTRGFADYVAVKEEYCFPTGEVPLELALGEPIACAVNAVELAAPAVGDDVVIIGAGFMGLMVQQLVQLRGPNQVIVADTRPDALERARALGAARVVNVLEESLIRQVKKWTTRVGADVAFEVTGQQAPLEALGKITRMSGTVVLAGYHQGKPRRIPLGQWNWMAFRIVNAHFRDVQTIMRGMQAGMRLLLSGRLSMEGMVTHSFPLEDIEKAFRTAVEKPEGFVKATVRMP
jgi:threonine dehydrogenase-like Zn-dependent dehydrogenase